VNYYCARQHATNGKWDYTCRNDGRIWPVGYCAEHRGTHDTAEEAQECYKRYMLDTRLRFDVRLKGHKRQCEAEGCEEWTQGLASLGGLDAFVLCDEHRDREHVEALYSVGESWSSY